MLKRAATVLASLLLIAGCGGSTHQSATGSVHPSGWGAPPAQSFGLTPQTSGQTALMYDSITLSSVPGRPFAVAGYTSGHWPTYLPMRRAWPSAHAISIAVSAGFHADCLDVEPFDATPSQVVGWIRADIKAGFAKPCIYSDYSEFVGQIRPVLAAAHIARSIIFEWDADFTGRPGITPGFDATQYDDHCLGRNLDCSTVTLAFLSIAQPPYSAPKPLPKCFHRRESEARCAAAHAQVASDQRAAEASGRALADVQGRLARQRCVKPYRRATCVRSGRLAHTFGWRVAWFDRAAAAIEAAN